MWSYLTKRGPMLDKELIQTPEESQAWTAEQPQNMLQLHFKQIDMIRRSKGNTHSPLACGYSTSLQEKINKIHQQHDYS